MLQPVPVSSHFHVNHATMYASTANTSELTLMQMDNILALDDWLGK